MRLTVQVGTMLILLLFFNSLCLANDLWLPPFEFDDALLGDVTIDFVDVQPCQRNRYGLGCVIFELKRQSEDRLRYYIQQKAANGKTLGSYINSFEKGEKTQKITFGLLPGAVLLRFNKND